KVETPTSGSIRLGDEKIDFAPGRKVGWPAIQKLRRQTGMVFQNFQLFPHQTAIANVMEGLVTVLKWPADKARARALELLEKVGMAHKADAWPATLSGGQQQRVAIARALVTDPAVLLADEPTGNLDTERSLEIMELLTDLNCQGITILMVTHEEEMAAYARTIVRFRDGLVEQVERGRRADRPRATKAEPA
uniref:ABC transporter ATP-binding protein n=1 Tax=Qipengyuania sp. TaxID=2004515 RepID=UPI003734F3C5